MHRQIDNDRKKYKVNENEFVYDHLTFSSELGDNNLGANCKCTPKLLKNVKYPDLPLSRDILHHPVPKLHKQTKTDLGNKEFQTLIFDEPTLSNDLSA